MPFPVGGALALGGALVSGISNLFGRKAADRRAVKFWQMQNEYNHPAKQMERLREAGLNPNLVYGQSAAGSTGQAGSISQPKRETYENPIQNLTKYADTQVRAAQANNLETQNTVLMQEAALKGAQTANMGIKNARDSFELGIAKELRDTSIQAAQQNVRLMEANTIGKEIDNYVKDQTKADLVKEAFYRVQNAAANLQGTELLNELRQLEINLNKLGIQKGDPIYWRFFGQFKDKILNAVEDPAYRFKQ